MRNWKEMAFMGQKKKGDRKQGKMESKDGKQRLDEWETV